MKIINGSYIPQLQEPWRVLPWCSDYILFSCGNKRKGVISMMFKSLRLNMLEECRNRLVKWDKRIVPEALIDSYGMIYQTTAASELTSIYNGLKDLGISEVSTVTKASLKLTITYITDKMSSYIRESSKEQSSIMAIASLDGKKEACMLSLSYLYATLHIYENRELQNYRILSQLRAAPGSGKLFLTSDTVIRQYKEVLNSHSDEFDFSIEPGTGINRNSTIISYSSK